MKDKFSSFWAQLRRDRWLILFCIVLGFLAWQSIRKNIGFEVTVSNIAVEVDLPDGWAVWENSVSRVNIQFRGSRETIRYLNNEQLKMVIPVLEPEHGKEMTIKLTDLYLKNPTGAKVVRFSPSEIVIRLDQEAERLLPVKASVDGTLPDGLEIDRIVCSPASVRVVGARQVLDEMINIHTEALELKDRQTSFKESLPIALPQGSRMTVEPDWVSVEVFLEERSSTQVLEKVPVRTLCTPGERRKILVAPQTISVTVSGQQQNIEQIRASDIFAYVSCYDLLEAATYELPVSVNLPDGLQLVKTAPSILHVEIVPEK